MDCLHQDRRPLQLHLLINPASGAGAVATGPQVPPDKVFRQQAAATGLRAQPLMMLASNAAFTTAGNFTDSGSEPLVRGVVDHIYTRPRSLQNQCLHEDLQSGSRRLLELQDVSS